jgi:hypothetical protein
MLLKTESKPNRSTKKGGLIAVSWFSQVKADRFQTHHNCYNPSDPNRNTYYNQHHRQTNANINKELDRFRYSLDIEEMDRP